MKIYGAAIAGVIGRAVMLVTASLAIAAIEPALGYAFLAGFGINAVSAVLVETYIKNVKNEILTKIAGSMRETSKDASYEPKDV